MRRVTFISFVKNVIKKSSLLSLSSILTNIEINSSFEIDCATMLKFLLVLSSLSLIPLLLERLSFALLI